VPGLSAPYSLIYTVEGLKEDCAAELAQVRDVLQTQGATSVTLPDLTGSEVWAQWMGGTLPGETVLRVGVAPKDLPQIMVDLATLPDAASFMASLGSGQLYVRGVQDVARVRQSARAIGGYAVVLSAPLAANGGFDRWGYSPDTLGLMRALKARWDTRGLLNPGAFVV